MVRNTFWSVVAWMCSAAVTHAEIVITQQGVPTQGLPGFTTWHLTANSTVPEEQIQVFDFAGDGSNDPATGRGFFGTLNQVHPFGLATIFDITNACLCGDFYLRDSYFRVNDQQVVVPPGFAEEGPNILQAIFSFTEPVGTSIPLAQLVIPNSATVTYRGMVSVTRGGTLVDLPVSGFVRIPEPASIVLVIAALLGILLTARVRGCIKTLSP